MSDQFQTPTSSAQSSNSAQQLAEFNRLYQLYLNQYHNQGSKTPNPIQQVRKVFGKGILAIKSNYTNLQTSLSDSNQLVQAIEQGQVSYTPKPFGRHLESTDNFNASQVIPATTSRTIPVVTQQARDRIDGFKAKLHGGLYVAQSNFLQPVPVRIVRQEQTPISWLTLGDNNLSRPEFDPYHIHDGEFAVSKMSKTLWPLSQEVFERPKDNAILEPHMMNALIYEQPRQSMPQRFSQFLSKLKLPNINPLSRVPRLQVSGLSISLFVFSLMFVGGIWASANPDLINNLSQFNPAQVAGATEKIPQDPETLKYNQWILEKSDTDSPKEDDLDNDELTNYEEFKLGTDPTNPNTCDPEKTDIQVLLEIRNPVTCEPLDLEDEATLAYYSYVLSLPQIITSTNEQEQTDGAVSELGAETSNSDLLSLFGVTDYKQISTLTVEQLEQELVSKNDKVEMLKAINKIDNYVQRNRSFEIYDRNYEPPVGGAVYLEVSVKYNVPLKYVLTIARLESRFGTDRFTNTGNPTRPGKHQNIYSMGLTDSGSNITYKSWEEGVAAFGKWYQRLEQKGVKDCTKWKIYNPNGDYCSKVEGLSSQIQRYLES